MEEGGRTAHIRGRRLSASLSHVFLSFSSELVHKKPHVDAHSGSYSGDKT